MQDKPEKFEVVTATKCQNCERAILVGETATQLPDLDITGTKGGVLCSDCTAPAKDQSKADKAAKAKAEKDASDKLKADEAQAAKDQKAADLAAQKKAGK